LVATAAAATPVDRANAAKAAGNVLIVIMSSSFWM